MGMNFKAYALVFAYKGEEVDNGIHGLLQAGKLDKAPQDFEA